MNPNAKGYKNYGGRGIKVCDEWAESFKAFYEWAVSNGYDDTLTIDRIDVDGDYEPENCRWVDRTTQANNKRNNRILEVNGVKHTMMEWERLTGINHSTIISRLKSGYTPERAVTEPPYRMLLFNGKYYTRKQLAEIHGINYTTFKCRLQRGLTIQEALQEKP